MSRRGWLLTVAAGAVIGWHVGANCSARPPAPRWDDAHVGEVCAGIVEAAMVEHTGDRAAIDAQLHEDARELGVDLACLTRPVLEYRTDLAPRVYTRDAPVPTRWRPRSALADMPTAEDCARRFMGGGR